MRLWQPEILTGNGPYYQKEPADPGDNGGVTQARNGYVTAGDQETATRYFTDVIMNYRIPGMWMTRKTRP